MRLAIASSMRARFRGLLRQDDFEGVLMLAPCNDVHTFGMRRPIDVAFVSADGSVLDVYRELMPNRRVRNRKAAATLERLSNKEAWYEPGDLVTLRGKNGFEKGMV